jgi:hypothetical protein
MVGYFFSPFGWLIQALGSGGGGGLVNAWLWSDGVSGILWSDGSTVMGVETP